MKAQGIQIIVEPGNGANEASLDVYGDKTVLAQAICGLMQVDARFQSMIMEAVINFMDLNHMTIHEYKIHNAEK